MIEENQEYEIISKIIYYHYTTKSIISNLSNIDIS